MMPRSLVVFPFKSEDVEVVARNVAQAAFHPRVAEVLCVGYEENECFRAIKGRVPELTHRYGKPIRLIVQERLGRFRPGKGDGMNTALRYFLEETDWERLHFYDADIETFSEDWITKAEEAADEGYQVVRHYFPRASTDAMITWMVTKTGLALLWPDSELPYVEQPLGGELLLSRQAAEGLWAEEYVRAQSDWGIDTVYTFAMVQKALPMYETYIPVGKIHKLYTTLADLKTMTIECFATLQGLRDQRVPRNMVHHVERPAPVPELVKEKRAYDVEGSLSLLMEGWTDRQRALLDHFPRPVQKGMLECAKRPRFNFMDEENWYQTYRVLLEHFDPNDEDWQELLFKLWVARVLCYTTQVALRGYDFALYYLYRMVERYAKAARRGFAETP